MLGIDVSSKKLDCARLDPATRAILAQRTVPLSEAGINELLSLAPPEVPWVVEPTGRYSIPVVEAAHSHGRRVLLAPNRRARAFLQSVNPRAKTDKIDSKGLALFALSQDLDEYKLKPASVDQLDQLLGARKLLSKSLSAIHLAQGGLPLAARHLKEAEADLKVQIQTVDRDIETMVTEVPELASARSLDAVPGIGPVCAAAIASRLTGKSFSHPDKFVAYCGLDIGVRQSGTRKGTTGITKHGDAELRRLLYLAAMAGVRTAGSPFKAQFDREVAKGLPKKAAYCAVARKIAGVCWSMVAHNREYDASRVGQAPVPTGRPAPAPQAASGTILSTRPEDRATLESDPSAESGAHTEQEAVSAASSLTGRSAPVGTKAVNSKPTGSHISQAARTDPAPGKS